MKTLCILTMASCTFFGFPAYSQYCKEPERSEHNQVFANAAALTEQGQWAEAIDLYSKAEKTYPDSPFIYLALQNSYYRWVVDTCHVDVGEAESRLYASVQYFGKLVEAVQRSYSACRPDQGTLHRVFHSGYETKAFAYYWMGHPDKAERAKAEFDDLQSKRFPGLDPLLIGKPVIGCS